MIICPRCGREYSDHESQCPYCNPDRTHEMSTHPLHPDTKFVVVYEAEDELSAHLMQGALVNNGVPAYIHTEQGPSQLFGSLRFAEHAWGGILVPDQYQERALDIVKAFSTPDAESETTLEQEAMAATPEDPLETR